MPTIFLSYSQHRSPAIARELAAAITQRFGVHALVTGQGGGTHSPAFSPAEADMVVVLIDASWPVELADMGDDAVLTEIARALESERRIITVLEQDAQMPEADSWPSELAAIVHRPSVRLDGDGFTTVLDLLDAGHGQAHAQAGPTTNATTTASMPMVIARQPEQGSQSQFNWILTGALLLGLFVLGAFLLTSRFWLSPPPDVVGEWVANVDYGRGVQHQERFNFRFSGNDLTGHASYFGTRRVIEEGGLDGETLHFVTRSRQYIGNTQHALRHAYQGQVAEDGSLHMQLQSSGGLNDITVEFRAQRPAN